VRLPGEEEVIMPKLKDIVIEQLNSGQYLFNKFTADLTDAEYFKIPVPGANHAAWIVGHVATSEDSLTAAATGKPKRVPENLQKLFKGGSPCNPEASKYPSRKEIDELFRTSRAQTVEALKAFDESTWGDPAPQGYPKELFPTLGSIWGLQGTHQFWHIGQLTVCRAALKKPHVLM